MAGVAAVENLANASKVMKSTGFSPYIEGKKI
jgi:hypothetical protein